MDNSALHCVCPIIRDASPGRPTTTELCVFDLRDWILDVAFTARFTADVTAQSQIARMAPQLVHRTTPITALGRPCGLQNARNSFCVTTPPSLFHQLFNTKWPYRDDTKCSFNVRSKADVSQLNLPHFEPTTKKWRTEKLKSKKNGYTQKYR